MPGNGKLKKMASVLRLLKWEVLGMAEFDAVYFADVDVDMWLAAVVVFRGTDKTSSFASAARRLEHVNRRSAFHHVVYFCLC